MNYAGIKVKKCDGKNHPAGHGNMDVGKIVVGTYTVLNVCAKAVASRNKEYSDSGCSCEVVIKETNG